MLFEKREDWVSASGNKGKKGIKHTILQFKLVVSKHKYIKYIKPNKTDHWEQAGWLTKVVSAWLP